jgi:hypothetical protein
MSHFKLTTFLATTATAMTPFLAVWYFPQQQQKIQQSAAATLAGLPKPRPLAALREQHQILKEKFGGDLQLL